AISETEIRAIFRRTEGWVAAMQLTALSGNNTGSPADQPATGTAGQQPTLSLNQQHISDYVLAEVLDKQSPEAVSFLLDTACCPRLCASLCDSVRKADDSQIKLENLLARNLFLIPLDNHNEWFRYHDLFRDA